MVGDEGDERPTLTDLTFLNRTFSKKYLRAEIDGGPGDRRGSNCCLCLVLIQRECLLKPGARLERDHPGQNNHRGEKYFVHGHI